MWVAALGLAWCLLLGSQTLAYASVWADEASFWGYTHRVEPGSAKALNNYGVALVRARRLPEAKAALSASPASRATSSALARPCLGA